MAGAPGHLKQYFPPLHQRAAVLDDTKCTPPRTPAGSGGLLHHIQAFCGTGLLVAVYNVLLLQKVSGRLELRFPLQTEEGAR